MTVNVLDVFICYLMVFVTLNLIVFKNLIQLFCFLFLSNCYRALLWSGPISFFSDVQVIFFDFQFFLTLF